MSTTITMADVIIINTALYITRLLVLIVNRIESNLYHYDRFEWAGGKPFCDGSKTTKQNKATIQATVKSNVDRHALLQTTITFLITFK